MTELADQKCPSWVADFDLMTDVDHHADPYPHYEDLRSACPVAHSERHGGYWIVTRHADISTVLREVEVFSSRQVRVDDPNSGMLAGEIQSRDGVDLGEPISLTTMDPPGHTAFRRLVVPLFSARHVQTWEPAIRAAAIELLETIKTKGSCEFSNEFAAELTILVFLDILGVPAKDREVLKAIHEKLSLVPQGLLGPEEARSYQIDELVYYAQLIEEDAVAAVPTDTVVSFLNRSEVDGRPLTLQEKMRLCQQFSRAGLHTTASTLSNMMCHLAADPENRDLLVQRPELARTAVEELLRYESIATPGRQVVTDTDLGGQHLRAGEMVMLPLGSAGRDESVFDQPRQVDFERTSIQHLAFGLGRHRCIGMHLARAELRIALEEIHRIIPHYRLMAGRTPVRHTGAVRTTNELWLEV